MTLTHFVTVSLSHSLVIEQDSLTFVLARTLPRATTPPPTCRPASFHAEKCPSFSDLRGGVWAIVELCRMRLPPHLDSCGRPRCLMSGAAHLMEASIDVPPRFALPSCAPSRPHTCPLTHLLAPSLSHYLTLTLSLSHSRVRHSLVRE